MSWHQDATYFGLEPPLQVTAWVAITNASIEAGCMKVTPGSRELGQLHPADHGEATHNLLPRGQSITVDVDKSRTEFIPVRAGQFSLHHTHLVHNSRSKSHRRPAHRSRPQLHPNPCALRQPRPTDRDAGAGHRPLRAFRRRAAATC